MNGHGNYKSGGTIGLQQKFDLGLNKTKKINKKAYKKERSLQESQSEPPFYKQ